MGFFLIISDIFMGVVVMRKFWSEEESKILAENYSKASKEELLLLLSGRGWPEIQAKANRIGLKRKVYPEINKRFWSKLELDTLKEKYPIMTKTELLETFSKRTLASVYAQAQRMNLRRDVGGPVWTKREEIVLKNMLEEGASEIELMCEFRNKTWPQILKKISSLKAKRSSRFRKKIYKLPTLSESFENLVA
jgi:hypothetical protein